MCAVSCVILLQALAWPWFVMKAGREGADILFQIDRAEGQDSHHICSVSNVVYIHMNCMAQV